MSLQFYIRNLSKNKQFSLAIRLVRLVIPIWNRYAEENSLSYIDTIVGLTHTVDRRLLDDAINAVEVSNRLSVIAKLSFNKQELLKLRHQFDDPIIALQDDDWKLPSDVKLIFYSVYNLIDASLGKETTSIGDSTIYISINQAVDILHTAKILTTEEVSEMLTDTKNGS